MMPAYIHIPFCKSKCGYCSFVSYTKTELIGVYISSLLKEINTRYQGEALETLYFGGGTPSLVPPELLKQILDCFNFQENAEITLELNPDDAEPEYLSALREIGINRLSIGAQTFDVDILKQAGRRHGSKDIVKAVEFAHAVGFDNISADFIYGLPSQTLHGVELDLERFLELDIRHISTYGLKIDEGSFWYKHYDAKTNQLRTGRDVLSLPDNDKQADMYEKINTVLEKNGFYRYEISNFSKRGYESKHNMNYWNNEEYYGFGAAAHGYINGIRYSNHTILEKYMNNPVLDEYRHTLTEAEKLEEEIFLGLRKTEGLNVRKIKEKYGIDFETVYGKTLEKYSDYFEKDKYALNLKGILISNIIMAEFMK